MCSSSTQKRLPAISDTAVWEKITKGRAGIRWDNVAEKIWKDLLEGDQELTLQSKDEFGGYKAEVQEIIEERERLALSNKVNEEKHLEIYGELREDIGMNTYLHGLMDYAKKLKLRFRVRDLDVPERRKDIPTSSRENMDAHMCLYGTTIIIESRTHIVGECEIYKEELDALEEDIRQLDECEMEEFGRLEISEKTIAILRNRWWPQTAKQDGDRVTKQFFM